MFEYEMHQLRAADLDPRGRPSSRPSGGPRGQGGRAGRRSARHESEGRVSTGLRRARFTRAA